jgi:HSP20 family molecular chaperone IbpA
MEINYGPFETVIELPSGYDLTRARAAYQNGFLRIDVPVEEAGIPHVSTIPVEGNEK